MKTRFDELCAIAESGTRKRLDPEGAVQKEVAVLHGTDADAPDGADPDAEEDKDRKEKRGARKEKQRRERAEADAPEGADPDAEEDKDRKEKKGARKESEKGKSFQFFPVSRCCGSLMAVLFATNL